MCVVDDDDESSHDEPEVGAIRPVAEPEAVDTSTDGKIPSDDYVDGADLLTYDPNVPTSSYDDDGVVVANDDDASSDVAGDGNRKSKKLQSYSPRTNRKEYGDRK